MGIVLGTLFIIWAGLTAGFGLYLQTRCARYLERGHASFFALSQITYPNASVIFDAAIAIKCFGVGVSYLIIIGDLMPGVVEGISRDAGGASFLMDRHFWVTAFMLIVIPFSFLRRLDSLKYTSIIALVSIGYLVVLVVAHFSYAILIQLTGHGVRIHMSSEHVFYFERDGRQLSAQNDGSCYLSFGDNVLGNIVSMYTPSVASTIGKAAIVILTMFSYPLQVHPCRASVDAVLRWRPKRFSSSRNNDFSPPRVPLLTPTKPAGNKDADQLSETRFAVITTGIIILSYIVAMTVSSLEKVLAYVGSTGSTSISFILPGLFFYKISDPDSPYHQRLMKLDDDEEDAANSEDDDQSTIRAGGRGSGGRSGYAWSRDILRKFSLALAIYGMGVMTVCLVSNTYFNATH
ncbi:MAG: hypothetical protein M1831_000058 [Alyxoria varia]|nr:MAG: hypothetical protein M1831_000058 [Alyxoria varia]